MRHATLQRPFKVMSTSPSSKMDGSANFLQWSDACCDAATGGILMSKIEDEACNLTEEMTLNNYQWSNERGQPERVRGKFYVDSLTLLTAKMDVMTQRLDRLNVNAMNSCASSLTCERCGSYDHVTMNCQVRNLLALFPNEHVAYVNNFQHRPNHDPYSNTYNSS